ncbi:MAG TPA: class I SAM-dependent methyltransferase [Thermoanaerobaculia bacterium]|nr:class I SAM-dependent methyltransferase [Thermoanaerobaculia bacterium]
MFDLYAEDLAWVHHEGFGQFALKAAPWIIRNLRGAGFESGRIVDLGCGSGLLARELTAAGYEVFGIDGSAAMVELARTVAPEAAFEVGTAAGSTLPPCQAIVALGEVLAYAPAGEGGRESLGRFLARARQALPPGGLLLFDLLIRGREKLAHRDWTEGPDWAVLIDVDESDEEFLVRTITTYRRIGESFRRSRETHLVRIFERKEVVRALRLAGFDFRTGRGYGKALLPRRRLAFHARRRG